MPIPIAKNTINGINRYGSLAGVVKDAPIGCTKINPAIRTMTESACKIFLSASHKKTKG